jgi:hypothetical protein
MQREAKGRTLSSATPAIKAELLIGDYLSVATSESRREFNETHIGTKG